MQRDAVADHSSHRIDQRERWAREPVFRGQIYEIQAAQAGELCGPRRRERAPSGRDRDQTRITAAWCEESGARLDLDDAAIAESGDLSQKLVIAEHGAREEHPRESAIDRPARLAHPRDPARQTAGHTRVARDPREELEICRLPGLRAIPVDEVQLLGTLDDQISRSRDDGLSQTVGESRGADVE